MADTAAWLALGYKGLEDYARHRLGWSRSRLYSRVKLVRRMRRLPIVRRAYREGRIGQVAAQAIAQILTQTRTGGVIPFRITDGTQQAWVDRASVTTIKRLNDEIRAMSRFMVAGLETLKQQEEEMRPANDKHQPGATRASTDKPQPGAVRPSNVEPQPLDDPTWQASLYRRVGTARQRVRALAAKALADPGPLVPLHLNLKPETARALRSALAATRRNPHLVATFSPDGGPVPEWVALLALLQEFVETWDVDLSGRRPSAQRIYARDGWRCMAPGCTSRKNLEIHMCGIAPRVGRTKPRILSASVASITSWESTDSWPECGALHRWDWRGQWGGPARAVSFAMSCE
jgi:hypothetical protein